MVGAGRMGRALAAALDAAGYEVAGPSGRGAAGADAEAVLLAVPDSAIAEAASAVAPGRLVGHVSGATSLAPLAPHEAFGLHPLTTVVLPGGDIGAGDIGADRFGAGGLGTDGSGSGSGGPFAGVHAAVDGTSERALDFAEQLARALGMRPFRLAAADRPAYHAAASIASNFLVVLEGFAERLAASAGVPREALAPLVRAAVRNWESLGAREALTGPVARGDEATVASQRDAVAERAPERLELFDALVAATRDLASTAPRGETRGAGR